MMNKIIALVIALLLLVGGGVYVITQAENDNNNSVNETSTIDTSSEAESQNDELFNAKPTANEAFTATITGTVEGEPFNGKLEFDGQGNGRFLSSSEEGSVEFYFTPEGYISCQGTECFSLPSGGPTPISLSDYTYSDEDFEDFKNTAINLGRQDCPAGTCDVWQITENGLKTKIYISTSDQRISQVVGTQNGETTTIVYEFGPVDIKIPENVQVIPGV